MPPLSNTAAGSVDTHGNDNIKKRPLRQCTKRRRRLSDHNGVSRHALISAADFAHAAPELPAQQHAERYAFGIADFGGDLIDAGFAGFK